MVSSSRGIKLSKIQKEKLSSQIKKCIFFRVDDPNSAEVLSQAIIQYRKAYSQGISSLELSESIDAELFYLGDLFEKALDLILEESVDAHIYAYQSSPQNYKDCLAHFAKKNVEYFDEDPILTLSQSESSLSEIKKEIAILVKDNFDKLKINCGHLHYKIKDAESPDLSTGGTYNSESKELYLYPLVNLIGAGEFLTKPLREFGSVDDSELAQKVYMSRADFVAALALETMIHELSHLVVPCTTEKAILIELITKETKSYAKQHKMTFEKAQVALSSFIALGLGESIPNILFYQQGFAQAISHELRFKFGLLYFLSTPGELQLVRTYFVPFIKKQIVSSQLLKFDLQEGISIDIPEEVDGDFSRFLNTLAYSWEEALTESAILGDLTMGFFKLTFRSEVVSTTDLEKTLEKRRSRSNYAKTKYQFVDRIDLADDDLLFAFEGNANILSIPFLEDPLDFMLQLVNRQELMSSRNARIGESAGLYMMFDNDEMRIKLVYSPDAETFFEITTGESWFILSL